MNREDVIRMAREAGIGWDLIDQDEGQIWYISVESLERFAQLVAAAERERCAEFCENQYEYYGHDHVFAAGIRARG